jgi:O-methyltransferase domain/Dimerisation domain
MPEPRQTESIQPSAAQTVLRMANAFNISQAIHVAAQLGLADLLAQGPLNTAALAEATHTHGPSLYRLLRMLVSLGVASEDGQGRFALTEIGKALQSNQTTSVRGAVLFLTSEWLWRAWGDLEYGVQTGHPAFDHVWGMSNFDYWAHNREAGRIHDAGMAGATAQQTPAIVEAYDYTPFKTIVDIGGGLGSLLAALLKAYPAAQGILYDLPQVVKDSGDVLAGAGVADRCTVVGGSFFESVPAGGDAYLLKWILHDWDDERALAILKVCRQAMPMHSTLLVIDQVLPSKIEPSPEIQDMLRRDLQMLVLTPGGRERTAIEFRQLLAAAGFEYRSISRTKSVLSIVESVCA